MLNVYFIRHAQSVSNVDKRNLINGHDLDALITEKGKEQCRMLGLYFKKKGIICDATFCSNAMRTQMTAKNVLSEMSYDGTVTIDENLVENHAGDWVGRERSIYNRDDIRTALDNDGWNFTPGNVIFGESHNDVANRMLNTLDKIVSYYSSHPTVKNISPDRNIHGVNIFVFSHCVAIRDMLAKLYHLNLNNAYKIAIDNTSVTLVRFENGKLINPLVKCKEYKFKKDKFKKDKFKKDKFKNDKFKKGNFKNKRGVDILLDENGHQVYSQDLWNNTDHLKQI
jgi:broad specificity phosphatase PhoE